MRLPTTCLVVMVGIAVASMSTSAAADNPLARPASREARAHLDRGNKLYNIGSFAEAIEEYKAGALIEPAPVFDYNLGQSNRQLGKYREALWHYDRFLHRGQPTGELHDAVLEFMAEMRSQLENQAQAMGPARRTPPAKPLADDRDDSTDWLGWTLAGSGVVALGVSGTLFYRASQLNHRGDSTIEMRARQNLYDQASTRNLASAIVGISGAALATAGIVKLVLHHHATPSSSVFDVGINRRSVFAMGRF